MRLIRAGILTLLAAGIVALANPIVFGSPQKLIHIQWRNPGNPDRPALEQQFRLAEATQIAETTWSYLPGDTSVEMLRTIVRHPEVADTDGIDRKRFVLKRNPLTPRRGGLLPSVGRIGGRAGKGASYLLGLLGGLMLVVGGLAHAPVRQRLMTAILGRRRTAGLTQ